MAVELSDVQATAILAEGLNRGMYEAPDNAVPSDPSIRATDAAALVEAVMKASATGNKSDNVQAIIHLAQNGGPVIEPEPEVVVQASVTSDGLDLTTLADAVLDGLIVGLDKYPNNEQVEADRKLYMAEKERRTGGSQEIQEIPQAAPQGEADKSPGEIGGEGPAAAAAPEGDRDRTDGQTLDGASEGEGDTSGSTGSESGDASAFARAQTPETVKETSSKATPPVDNPNRLKLESELTLPMVKAHGVDITKLTELTVEALEFIVANPNGPTEDARVKDGDVEGKLPVSEAEIESSAVPTDDRGGKAVGVVAGEGKSPEVVVSKESLGISADDDAERSVSDEREKLEIMVTGPMLKAYGRGRKDIPAIGDNELRFMIMNADAKVTMEELEAARAKDGVTEPPYKEVKPAAEEEVKVTSAPAEDRSIAEAAVEATEKATNVLPEHEIATPEKPEMPTGVSTTPVSQSGQARAMEIINKENFPIPPDIGGQPPILPNDVSEVTRDQLFSLHAKFHACESRINWVISGFEDELGDKEKLKAHREIAVAAGVPLVIDDKRVTNEYRDAQVASDSQVLEYDLEIHEAKKTVNKLKVLQRNYHADCERLSRQMSKYERERLDAPRQ